MCPGIAGRNRELEIAGRIALRLAEELVAVDHGGVLGRDGDWTEAGGEKAVASWLRLKTTETLPPNVVASQNDLMAAGARRETLTAVTLANNLTTMFRMCRAVVGRMLEQSPRHRHQFHLPRHDGDRHEPRSR